MVMPLCYGLYDNMGMREKLGTVMGKREVGTVEEYIFEMGMNAKFCGERAIVGVLVASMALEMFSQGGSGRLV